MIARFAAVRLVLMLLVTNGASAQSQPAGPSQTLPTIDVFAPTPLAGSVIDVEKVPANVTVVDSTRTNDSGHLCTMKNSHVKSCSSAEDRQARSRRDEPMLWASRFQVHSWIPRRLVQPNGNALGSI